MSEGWLAAAGRFLWFPRPRRGPSSKLYTWTREVRGRIARYHLRTEAGGAGQLIVNASVLVQLSPAGVAAVRARLDGWDLEQAQAAARGATPLGLEAPGSAQIAELDRTLDDLARPQGIYPTFNLADPWASEPAGVPQVPLRAELALFDCGAAPHRTGTAPAQLESVREILRQLWDLGVPQVQLLGQGAEPAELLRGAVLAAEDLGMIAGVRLPATALARAALLDELVQAGVDAVAFPLASAAAPAHDALLGPGDFDAARALARRTQELEIAAVAEVPLTDANADALPALFELLAAERFEAAAVYALATPSGTKPAPALAAEALAQAAVAVIEASEKSGVRFLWQAPLWACPTCSVPAQLRRGPRGTTDPSIFVDAAGEVFAPRGPYRSAGNLLRQDWEQIAASAPMLAFRDRSAAITRCETCPGLELCAADCPKQPRSWAPWCEVGEASEVQP
ncbi:MAG TPA: hypothetical protein VGB99_09630 [Acidobacteriota bacterium]